MKRIAIFLGHPKFLDLLINIGENLKLNGCKVEYITESKLAHLFFKDVATRDKDYTSFFSEIRYYQRTFLNLYHVQDADKYVFEKLKNMPDLDRFDSVVFWNGLNSLEYEVCLQKNKNVICIENGYISNTLQISKRGVNALSDTNGKDIGELNDLAKRKGGYIASLKLEPHPLRRVSGYIKIFLGVERLFILGVLNSYKLVSFYVKEFVSSQKQKLLIKAKTSPEKKIFQSLVGKKNIFFVFQVHDDTQIFINSSLTNSMDLIERFEKIKDHFEGCNIIVKIHPKDIGRYDYDSKLRDSDIYVFYTGSSDDFIEISEYVILINSSVGFQALKKGKKVISYGDTLYNGADCHLNLYAKEINVHDAVGDFMKKKGDIEKNELYLNLIEKNLFLKGAWHTFTSETISNLIKHIIYHTCDTN